MDFDLNVSYEQRNDDFYDDATSNVKDGEHKESSLCLQLEAMLSVCNIVDSLEEAYLLYCEYGRLRGFSVRKGDQTYFVATNEIRTKEFKCSCEGNHNDCRSKQSLPAYKKQNTRTNCKAWIRFVKDKRDPGAVWKVQKFSKEHNHELVPVNQAYLLRSTRHLSHAKRSLVEALKSSGIGVSRVYRFFQNEIGGPHSIGFAKKDVYNHFSSKQLKSNVDNAEANALVQFFVSRAAKEPLFIGTLNWIMKVD